MKVKFKNEPVLIRFCDLFVGRCFMYNGSLYIKTRYSDEEYNAFNCNTNETVMLTKDVEIEPREMILVEVNEYE